MRVQFTKNTCKIIETMDTIQGTMHITLMDKYIPLHLITEILFKLPFKSLVKFRFVSKSWFSLISSPQFNKARLKFHKSLRNQRLLTLDDSNNFKHCSLNSFLYRRVSPYGFDLDIQIPPGPSMIVRDGDPDGYPYIFAKIIGSCDGLVCIFARGVLGDQSDIILWNPSIGNYKKLSDSGLPLGKNYSSGFWGFGYDGLSDDYKVMVINRLVYGASKSFQCGVYNMKTEAWRRIVDFPRAPLNVSNSGVLVEGKLHFLASDDDDDVFEVRYIVSLDLTTEMYGELEIPKNRNGGNFQTGFRDKLQTRLGEIGGKLFLFEPYLQGDHLWAADVWIRKEYGESWIKMITFLIPPSYLNGPPSYLSYLNDPGIREISIKCELLILECEKIGLYKPREGESLRHFKDFKELKNVGDACCFVESLVWPSGRVELNNDAHYITNMKTKSNA